MISAQATLTPVQHQLTIEWQHLDVDGATCVRCSETGKTLQEVIEDLTQELSPQGITVSFVETKLREEAIAQSNQILFNSVALEDLLAEVTVAFNACGSCSQLIQRETYCRTIEHEGKVYTEVPEAVIRKAALKTIERAV